MPRRTERPFDPNAPVYATRKFKANGRSFEPGMLLDWKQMSVSQRTIMLLADQNKVSNEPIVVRSEPHPDDTSLKAPAADPAPALPIPAATGDDLDAIDDMKELRRIAEEEGAPTRVSKADQREAIRENRASAE